MLFVEAYYPKDHGGKDLRRLTPDMFPEWVGQDGFRDKFFDHVNMLFEEKMLYMMETQYRGKVLYPTWAGYDFIDEIRDPKWFAKIKKAIGSRPWTIAIIRKTNRQLWKAAERIAGIIEGTIANWILAIIAAGIAWFFGFFG
jgi:hypothetical protein